MSDRSSRPSTQKSSSAFRNGVVLSGVAAAAFCFGALWMSFLAAGSIYEELDPVSLDALPADIDVIVCLAGARGRLTAASEVWGKYWKRSGGGDPAPGKVPVLYLSGTGRRVGPAVEAFESQLGKEVREPLLKSVGTEETREPRLLVIEDRSANTIENAEWFGRVAELHGWKRALLMTSSYHMKRARFLFERFGANDGKVHFISLPIVQEPFSAERWRTDFRAIRITLDEFFKLSFYRATQP